MEVFLECLPCFLKQALEASRMATSDKDVQVRIMKETAALVCDFERYKCSPQLGREMHQIVKKHTGNSDPYRDIKDQNIKNALEVYPWLKHFLFKKTDRLYWGLKIAAAGNIIDSAIYADIDIKGCVEKEVERKFAVCDIKEFSDKMMHAKNLLIVADNAGETVFDRVFIEEVLNLDITYAVRAEPIINDATIEDARESGLGRCTNLISTGCNAPGLIIEECDKKFLDLFYDADIVVSKGQGNFESLSDEKRAIFFLLKAKCPVVAENLGVAVNDYVFKYKPFL
ncbi:MAG: DUF89 family protein [Clostridium sp.]|nr:DUF89 family protein [Clostridium sp.]